jgi:virginiamycin B lyase
MSATRRIRIGAVAGAALAAALAASGPAHAAPAVSGEFSLPGDGTPKYLALGPDGNVWVPIQGASNGDDVAKIAPDGSTVGYNVPNLQDATGIASDGTYLWVTRTAAVSRFLPSNPVGAENFAAAGVDSRAITLGGDGNLWTGGNDQAIKINPANGGATAVPVPGMGTPEGVAAGGDGALYFASFGTQRVTRVTTAGSASFTGVDTDNTNGARQVAAGPGNQIAFTSPAAKPRDMGFLDGGAALGPASVTGGASMPGADPEGITYANDGAYWIARFAANDVARVTSDGTFTTLPLSANSGPRRITKGAGDTLWVGLETAKKVARITGVEAPAAPVTPTPTPTPITTPTTTPALSKLKVTPNALRRGSRLPALTTAKTGSQLRFTLTTPATVRFTFAKGTVGRKIGSSCVKRTRQNAKRTRCVHHTPVRGSFSVTPSAAGDHRVRFQGRVSAKQALRPGRYRVTARATGADGTASAPANATFTIKAS